MDYKKAGLIAGFLLFLNVVAWQEIFVLAGPRYLKVDFLNVGQGDSAFIETPEGQQILIDGGPTSAVLEKLAERMPFWDREIDAVILSHPESDHMAGILDVLQKYKVDYFLWSGVYKDNAENKKLATLLNDAEKPENKFLASLTGFSGTKVLAVSTGEKIVLGKTEIDILSPLENLKGKEIKDSTSTNDTCVVDKIIYGKNSFLFTGDIDSKLEKELVDSGENISANVLKVAHHGSKYSSSDLFLQDVAPEYAVIEVGKNTFGHPTPETLQRLQNSGIKVKRTDQSGDIEFLSDGNKITLK